MRVKDEQKTEFVMLGLRLEKGFSVSGYTANHKYPCIF